MKYRKKPVVVEAWQFLPDGSNADRLATMSPYISIHTHTGKLMVSTMEGLLFADPGDWIIKGIKGELYPCKPDIFAAVYEQVDAHDEAAEITEAKVIA